MRYRGLFTVSLAIITVLLGAFRFAGAQDAPAVKAAASKNVTGSWKWSLSFGDNSIDFSMKVKQDGEKFTGKVLDGFDNTEMDIKDGAVKGDQISFKTERKLQEMTITATYTGKIDGDAIKGSMEAKIGDQEPMKVDWNAKRVTEDAATTKPATRP